jgi:hypothetical protein
VKTLMGLVSDLRAAIGALVAARGFSAIAISIVSNGLALAAVTLTVLNA